jgi:anti-anti-sigma regulatory factor
VFTAIKLLGGRIGLCGINPGLAAVIVTTQLNFHREVIGSDLDDVTASLLQR